MCFFFFNDTATTEIYTLSLHDALPICREQHVPVERAPVHAHAAPVGGEHVPAGRLEHPPPDVRDAVGVRVVRSEEHTSELQSRQYLVCRLLLEKKKKHKYRS